MYKHIFYELKMKAMMQQLGERRVTPGSDLPATPLPAALHGHQ